MVKLEQVEGYFDSLKSTVCDNMVQQQVVAK